MHRVKSLCASSANPDTSSPHFQDLIISCEKSYSSSDLDLHFLFLLKLKKKSIRLVSCLANLSKGKAIACKLHPELTCEEQKSALSRGSEKMRAQAAFIVRTGRQPARFTELLDYVSEFSSLI